MNQLKKLFAVAALTACVLPVMGHRTKRVFQWSGKMGERF